MTDDRTEFGLRGSPVHLSPKPAQPARFAPPVRSGDRVGVAALSSAVDRKKLAHGLCELERLGFEPVLARNLEGEPDDTRLFAGTDTARVEGFHELLRDPSIRAIFFARGGHGVLRILDRLDWSLLQSDPRPLIGYSDLTPVLNLAVERAGTVALHGPMVAVDMADGLTADEEASLLASLAGEPSQTLPLQLRQPQPQDPISAPLSGGSLSMLVATLGTPYFPALSGTICLLEDVNEPEYRLDRMLTQLRLSGKFLEIEGFLLGYLTDPSQNPSLPRPKTHQQENASPSQHSLNEPVWLQPLQAAGPVATGLPCGHERPNWTLPIGHQVTLDPVAGELLIH